MKYEDELVLLSAIDDILVKYSRWDEEDQWFLRVRFISSLTDVVKNEPGKASRLGPQITQSTRRPLDLVPFTDQDIRCARQLFFLLLADALSGDTMHDWTASELDATGTDWAYSWAHTDPSTRATQVYTFYSETPPKGCDGLQVPATWFFKKS